MPDGWPEIVRTYHRAKLSERTTRILAQALQLLYAETAYVTPVPRRLAEARREVRTALQGAGIPLHV